MALQRQLLLAALALSPLLLFYVLCVNLEGSVTWPLSPLKHFYRFIPGSNTASGDSEEASPLTFRPKLQQKTQDAPHRPGGNQDLGPPQSSSTHNGDDSSKSRRATLGPVQTLIRPPGPTEPPFIGDVYMRENIPPQSDCPTGIRTRVASTSFGERFLADIPVLQWLRHVTPDQYQRLSQYTGTHGWGSIDYDTLQDTMSVLNLPANRLMLDDWAWRRSGSQCIRCAVVGNGGILRDSKKGDEIDGHHYVFRTNGAIIKGFEGDVGSRTTHYTFSTNTMRNSMRSYAAAGYKGPPISNETRYVFLPDHDRDYLLMKAAATHTQVEKGPERNKDPTTFFGKDVSANKLKIYHPDFVRYLRNRFLRSSLLNTRHKNIYRPSTGAVMLLAALHTCDQVSAYGFMTPDYINYSDHYYDKTYHRVGFFINHDLRMEMTLWQQLHQAGLIQLLMHK